MNAHHANFKPELPDAIEAEQALLGAILINNDALDAIDVPLDPKHFSEKVHADMFDAFVDMRAAGRKINTITAKPYVGDGMIGDLNPSQYLARLATGAVSIINVPDLAYAIMESAARRACVQLGGMVQQLAYSAELDISDDFDALKQRFEDVVSALSGQSKGKTLASAARRALDKTASALSGHGVIGVDYGLPFLMNMIGPLLPGQQIIIGGMTKHGKSSLIEQIVAGAAMNGHPVWVYSGEMKDEELAQRALARITDIRVRQQVSGRLSDSEYEALEVARKRAETWQDRVTIRDDGMTLAQIKRELTAFSKRNKNGLAVIDHIGLVEKGKDHAKTGDVEFASIVTRSLKLIASGAGIPMIAAAQLKKNTFGLDDRKPGKAAFLNAISRRPRASDIFGSCEKDANHLIIPFRAEAILQDMEPADASDLHPVWEEVMDTVRDRAEIVLALSRHERWPQRKEVGWNGRRTMFEELNKDRQETMF